MLGKLPKLSAVCRMFCFGRDGDRLLSSLLNVREAAVFRQLAERIRSRSDNRAAGLSTGARDLVTPLERELKAALRLAPARSTGLG